MLFASLTLNCMKLKQLLKSTLLVWAIFMMPLCQALEWKQEAGEFKAKASINKDHISLFDDLVLTLELSSPIGYQADPAKLRAQLLGNGNDAPFRLVGESRQGTSIVYSLSPQLPGTHYLTFWNIVFQPLAAHAGKPEELLSGILEVKVTMNGEQKIAPIVLAPLLPLQQIYPVDMDSENRINIEYDPAVEETEAQRNRQIMAFKSIPWLEIVGFLGVLVLALLMKKKGKAALQEINPESAREKALRSLETLMKSEFNDNDFYVNLIGILRNFIEEVFPIQAHTRTSEEFLEGMSKYAAFSPEKQAALKQFLENADKVKFAKLHSSNHDREQAVRLAQEFIETKN